MIKRINDLLEERRLNKWLRIALSRDEVSKVVNVAGGKFMLEPTEKFGLPPSASTRYLNGRYSKKWPTIKGAASDCRFRLGEWTLPEGSLSLSAWIVSGRVGGFLFISDENSFPVLPKTIPEFICKTDPIDSVHRPEGYPDWLPDAEIEMSDIRRDFKLPEPYVSADAVELFTWFSSLELDDFLFSRPGSDDVIEFNGHNFLHLASDDCGSALALKADAGSVVWLLADGEPEQFAPGIRSLFEKE